MIATVNFALSTISFQETLPRFTPLSFRGRVIFLSDNLYFGIGVGTSFNTNLVFPTSYTLHTTYNHTLIFSSDV
jgi:hypothetical protein